jgi:hypothetical protein
MRWLVFKGQFRKESINRRLGNVVNRIRLGWNRIKLSKIHHPIEKEINELWCKAKKDYRLKFVPGVEFSEVVSLVKSVAI